MRRSGKSVLLQLIQKELTSEGRSKNQFVYMNMEDLANEPFLDYRKLHDELSSRVRAVGSRCYIFLDEIQMVDQWEKVVNSLRVTEDCDIYITGSNSKLLSGEMASLLSGRYIEIQVYPFSFREFLEAIQSDRNDLQKDFSAYLETGGMPFLSMIYYDKAACIEYLEDICNSVILNDIVSRHAIRDVDLLKRLIAFLSSEIGHPVTASSISRYLKSENRKASVDTIMDYINYCCEAFLFQKVSCQDLRGKKSLRVNEKYYIMDQGICQTILGNNARDIDQILENIVFLELLRCGYHVSVGRNGKQEIDFVCEKAKEKKYIQVAYSLSNTETAEREFGAFKGIQDNYPKYVLSMDTLDFSRDGLIHQNIIDFLMAE